MQELKRKEGQGTSFPIFRKLTSFHKEFGTGFPKRSEDQDDLITTAEGEEDEEVKTAELEDVLDHSAQRDLTCGRISDQCR